MEYFRNTDSDHPMSDWGHAMFCDDEKAVKHYGDNQYVIDVEEEDTHVICAYDDKFIDAATSFYNDHFRDLITDVAEQYDISEEEATKKLVDEMNPSDIVNSAEFWDTSDIGLFYDQVLCDNNWLVVVTYDGCIVFDDSFIK